MIGFGTKPSTGCTGIISNKTAHRNSTICMCKPELIGKGLYRKFIGRGCGSNTYILSKTGKGACAKQKKEKWLFRYV